MTTQSDKALVVLIHGIASGRATMWPLAWWAQRAGFETKCFGYASCFRDIQHHGNRFRNFLFELRNQQRWPEIHIVAHSLGGIVTRHALANETEGCPEFVKRVVMLGTPQKGSPNACWLSRRGLWFVKSLGQVSNHPTSFVNQLPNIEGPQIGTIAGSYDFVIPIESGHVEGEVDYVRPFSGHNGLLVRPKVAKLVVRFLKNGRFS